jgi:hypothetical protein
LGGTKDTTLRRAPVVNGEERHAAVMETQLSCGTRTVAGGYAGLGFFGAEAARECVIGLG